jgi:plastocyanin
MAPTMAIITSPPVLQLKVGTTLRFLDADSVSSHRIHASGGNGFDHQLLDMTQGEEYDIVPTLAGSTVYVINCHNHPGSGDSLITVVP